MCGWSAAMDGYKLFRRDRLGKRSSGVTLYVRKHFSCLKFNAGNNKVECSWLRIRGKTNKADILVGVYNRPPNQDKKAEEILYILAQEVPGVCGRQLPDTAGQSANQGRCPTGPAVYKQRRISR